MKYLKYFKINEVSINQLENNLKIKLSNLYCDAIGNTYNLVFKGDEKVYELGFDYFVISTRGKDQQSFYLYNRNIKDSNGKLPMIFRDAKLDSNDKWVGNEQSILSTIKSKPWLNLNYFDLYGMIIKYHKIYDKL